MIALFLALVLGAAAEPADLVLENGKIFLGPGRYVSAIAVRGNRIAAVGTDAELKAWRGPATRVVALKGRSVTPGFEDAHARLIDGALSMTEADLAGAVKLEEVQRRLGEFADAHPDAPWVVARGWRDDAFPNVTAADLDAVISTRPVVVTSYDLRKTWLNTEALRLAGVTRTMDVSKRGRVSRDKNGRPTGILLDAATSLAERALPKAGREAKLEALRKALALARREGVTAFHVMPGSQEASPEETIALWKTLSDEGAATARLALFGRLGDAKNMAKLRAQAADWPRTKLQLVGLAGEVDGDFARRTAALLGAYSDDRSARGQLKQYTRSLAGEIEEAHEQGFQVALRASGDRGVRQALDACDEAVKYAKKQGVVVPAVPCRVEGAELIDPEDLRRFNGLHAAASVQPAAAIVSDLGRLLGGRAGYAFAWKPLEDTGAAVAFGSGWPKQPLSPRLTLMLAARQIPLEAAVKHYTAEPARIAGLGDQLGELAPGKLADLVVFDRDIFTARELSRAVVDLTIFDGKIVYERQP